MSAAARRPTTASALRKNPELEGYGGQVSDSGEGRWTIQTAIDQSVPTPVLSAALHARFTSRGHADFSNKVLYIFFCSRIKLLT